MTTPPPDSPVRPLAFAALTPGMTVVGHARVVQAEVALARNSTAYHRLTLGDPFGHQIAAKRFGVGEEPVPAPGSVVDLCGVVETYQGTLSVKLTTCVPAPAVPVECFLPRLPAGRRATLEELDRLIAQIPDAAIGAWVSACLAGSTREQVQLHPAAQRMHGAVLGGLLAHTVRVTRIALFLAELTTAAADVSIVMAGSLLHDLGKLDELLPDPGAGVTDKGTLIGHITLGTLRAARVAATVPGLDPGQVDLVLHCLVASHGKLEYGSPVVPATIEALLVHLADLAEAKLEAALEVLEAVPAHAQWSAYHRPSGTRWRRAAAS